MKKTKTIITRFRKKLRGSYLDHLNRLAETRRMSLYSAPLLQTAAGYAPGNVENAKNRGIIFVFCVFRYLDVELQVWGGGVFCRGTQALQPWYIHFSRQGAEYLGKSCQEKKSRHPKMGPFAPPRASFLWYQHELFFVRLHFLNAIFGFLFQGSSSTGSRDLENRPLREGEVKPNQRSASRCAQ